MHNFPDLMLPEEFILPDYAGGSIANVPATIAALLQVSFQGLPPLLAELWQPLSGGVQRVVLLIVDSLGWQIVERERPSFDRLLANRHGILSRLTSVFPSTTVAALSSLWTGFAPIQHGLVGLNMLTPEYGTLTQFIHFTPTFGSHPDALVSAGLNPSLFLEVPGFAEQLASAGVSCYAYKSALFVDSAMSQMHGRGVLENHGVHSAADLLVQMRRLLEAKAGLPLYAVGYWHSIDSLMHARGWDHPSVFAEARSVLALLQKELLDALSPAARAGTVFLLVSDHGQVNSPPNQYVLLRDHPDLERLLLLRPAGEPRAPYFYVRHGCQEKLLAYLNRELAQAMVGLPAAAAADAGLFGPKPFGERALARLGDVVGIMKEGFAFMTAAELSYAQRMQGRHGGLLAQEMAVPWLGIRLDD